MADTVILDSIAVGRPIHSSMGLYQIDGWHCYYWLLQLVSEPSIFQCVSTTDTVILTIVESKWAHPYLNAFLLDWWLILLFLTTAESKWIHPYLNGFLLDWWLIVLFSTIAGCKWTHPSLSALQDLIPSGFPIPTCTPSRKDSDYDSDIPADLDEESVDFMNGADEMGEDTAARISR